MAGTEARKSRDYESFKRYGKRVTDLAERLGWPRVDLWKWFREFQMLSQYELGVAFEIAGDVAFRLLSACIDKVNRDQEIN